MKYILSTLEKDITFPLSGTRTVLISSTNPIDVSDEEFNMLHSRLGSQIKEVEKPMSEEETKVDGTTEDQEADVQTEASTEATASTGEDTKETVEGANTSSA